MEDRCLALRQTVELAAVVAAVLPTTPVALRWPRSRDELVAGKARAAHSYVGGIIGAIVCDLDLKVHLAVSDRAAHWGDDLDRQVSIGERRWRVRRLPHGEGERA